MKIIKIKAFFFMILVIISIPLAGDYYSNINKNLFVFPQYLSLGGSNLSYSRDGTQLNNPANLPLESWSRISLAYSGYFDNSFSTSTASFVAPINKNIGIGLATGYLYIPDIEITSDMNIDEFIYNPSYSSSSELFLNVSIGYKIIKHSKMILSVGAAFHCLRRRLIDWTGYGIGVDIGSTIFFNKPGIRFSLLIDDITTNYIHWSSNYHDNGMPHIYTGLGWRKEYPYIYGSIGLMYKSPDLLTNEGVMSNSRKSKLPEKTTIKEDPLSLIKYGCYGFEYIIQKIVTLHLGFDELKRTSFGGGLNLLNQSLSFDFAYIVSYDLPGTYSLSSSYQW
jgi:hypothetical protein